MWISSASKPASTRVSAASAYAVVTRARSSSVAARTHWHRQRARHAAGGDRAGAVLPAVGHRPGMAELTGEPGAGRVDRLRQPGQPGAVSRPTTIPPLPVGPSGATARSATVVRPTPPSATARW